MVKKRTNLPNAIAGVAPDGDPTPRQRRRIMIDMALRRAKPGTGSSREFLQRRTAIHDWPDLRPVLDGIPWALAGGIATRAYMPERMTQDMDVIVRREDYEATRQRFRDHGYEVAATLDAPYFVARRRDDDLEVDVMCVDFPWVDEALADPAVDPDGYPVLDLPYLILMKLRASRAVDIGDMTRMLGLADDEDVERVRGVVAEYQPEDSDDLEALILLGKQEMDADEGELWHEGS